MGSPSAPARCGDHFTSVIERHRRLRLRYQHRVIWWLRSWRRTAVRAPGPRPRSFLVSEGRPPCTRSCGHASTSPSPSALALVSATNGRRRTTSSGPGPAGMGHLLSIVATETSRSPSSRCPPSQPGTSHSCAAAGYHRPGGSRRLAAAGSYRPAGIIYAARSGSVRHPCDIIHLHGASDGRLRLASAIRSVWRVRDRSRSS
jgi:hypothetical protein